MDSYYNNNKRDVEDDIIIPESDHDNIDELLRSPILTPSTSHSQTSPSSSNSNSSSMFLFDYTDLNDMDNNSNDMFGGNDHTAELNYKLWLNSNMIKI